MRRNDKKKFPFRERIAFKSISGIVVLLAVFSAVVSIIGYRGFTQALLDQYAEGAFQIAETAAMEVDSDQLDLILERGPETPEYRNAWERMNRLCNSSGATFIYVIQPDRTDYKHITFLFSTMNRDSSYTHYEFGYVRETTNDDYRQKYQALYEGKSDHELVIRDHGYIETNAHITAMIALKGKDLQTKGILCVQRQMDGMTEARRTYVRKVIMLMIALAAVVTVGQGLYLNRVLLFPVKKITEEAGRFAAESVPAEQKLTEIIQNRDEIGLLADSIDRMEEQLQSYIRDLTQITAEKERIGTELSLATRIQTDMMPHIFPAFPERKEFSIYALMDPAKEVGGDFYDFFLINDDHLCMIMADVSGKGIPAALFMMAVKIILSNGVMSGKSPAQVLESANREISGNNQEEMFVTVWIGILEISTGRVTAANAGHEYPVLKQPGRPYELVRDPHGFVIGGIDGMKYREYELMLEHGAKLFVYTDGVPEATDENGNMYGTGKMLETLNEEPDASPERVLRNVHEAVDRFIGKAEQFDDLTMLCMEYSGPQDAVPIAD